MSAIESASRSEDASGSGGDETAPFSLAAAAPAAATTDQPAQGGPAGEGATAFGADRAPVAPSAPEAAPDTADQSGVAILAESQDTDPRLPTVAAEDGVAAGATATIDNQIAKRATIEEPAAGSVPILETAGPELLSQGDSGDTSVWWRVLEAAAGALAVVFLAGLALRWRTNRHGAG